MANDRYKNFIRTLCKGEVLDLGCGNGKLGDIGVDIVDAAGADIIHDLNEYPYPFQSESFETILMHHSLEHLKDIHSTLKECRRILKKDGKLIVVVPHPGSNNYLNEGHIHFFTGATLRNYLGLYFRGIKTFGWKGTVRTIFPARVHKLLGRIRPSQIIAIARKR